MADSGGDITNLSASRPWLEGHGIEHLRGDDHRHAAFERLVDDDLLGHGNVLERNLNAKVPPGDHDGVGHIENAVEVLQCHGMFDFRHDRGRAWKPLGPLPWQAPNLQRS